MLAELEEHSEAGVNPEPFLHHKSSPLFFNPSTRDWKNLADNHDCLINQPKPRFPY